MTVSHLKQFFLNIFLNNSTVLGVPPKIIKMLELVATVSRLAVYVLKAVPTYVKVLSETVGGS